MSEDPIFDPWSLPDEDRPDSPRRASRWRARTSPPQLPTSDRPEAPTTVAAVDSSPEAPPPAEVSRAADRSRSLDAYREAVRSRIRSAANRLLDFRHGVAIDDRLDEGAIAIRLRIEPAIGPMDDPVAGFVLEISATDRGDVTIVSGRIWDDPLAVDPASEIEAPLDRVGDRWLDRLILDFVERALRRD